MISGKVLVFVVVLGVAWAYGPGEYVPRSYYVIDHYGHQSEPVFIRNRRSIMNTPLFRVRRGDSYASSSAHSSASASASSGSSSGGGGAPNYYGDDYIPSVAHDPSGILGHVQNLLNNIPSGPSGAGAQSFASSSSSSSSGIGGNGAANGQSYGGLGSGQNTGYQGPILFSRFGETEGSGVQVSGQAQGNKAAFSQSSSSIDDKGKITYSVQSGKY